MFSACSYVYADKFTACVQNVRLGLKCLKRHRVYELTSTNELTRLIRSKQLLRWFSNTDILDFTWFTDEKVFSVATSLNTQNDRVYVPMENRRNVLHRNVSCADDRRSARPSWCPSEFQNSAAQSCFFVELGVKINGAYYRDVLLTQKLLPVIRQFSGNEFVFQQDSAPASRARKQTMSSRVKRCAELYFTGKVATEQSRS